MPAAIVVIRQNFCRYSFPCYLNAARMVLEGTGENVIARAAQATDTVRGSETIPRDICDRRNEK